EAVPDGRRDQEEVEFVQHALAQRGEGVGVTEGVGRTAGGVDEPLDTDRDHGPVSSEREPGAGEDEVRIRPGEAMGKMRNLERRQVFARGFASSAWLARLLTPAAPSAPAAPPRPAPRGSDSR